MKRLPHAQAGFSLIEVLVVIVIMGLMLNFVVINVGSNDDKIVETEARRFGALLRLAAEESIMRARETAVELSRYGYQFLVLDDEGQWQPFEDGQAFRPRELPAGLHLDGELNDEALAFAAAKDTDTDDEEKATGPRIFLFSSGEMTPFKLEFRMDFGPGWGLSGDAVGKITLDGRLQT